MTHTIIHTDNYLLVVDGSEIKEGDYCTTDLNVIDVGIIHKSYTIFNPKNKAHLIMLKGCKKIIAHLPLNGSPILQGVDLLPPLEQEDDVEKLAKDYLFKEYQTKYKVETNDEQFGVIDGYMSGYNKAKEKYKYTEKDVLRIIDMAKEEININPSYDDNMWVAKYSKDEIIQSLSQPKMPIGFECEYQKPSENFGAHMANFFGQQIPKTTTNSQGQTVWVGKYIY